MTRYILIDNCSGYIFGDSADLNGRIFTGTPTEYAAALDASIGERGRVYEAVSRHALANNETYGIWGGKSESERRTLRRAKGVMRDRRLKPIAHGTNNGYTMHRRRHELPCDGCRSAHSEYLALTVKARQR